MLEIVALIFLTRKIGALATQKRQNPGRWKLYTVLAWFGFEIVGLIIGMAISQQLLLAVPLGLGFAFGGYLLMKYQLDKMPDDTWEQQIGKTDDAA